MRARPGYEEDGSAVTLRVLLADDHARFRRCLARLLDDQPGLSVVAQAGGGVQAVQAIQACTARDLPDVVVMDIVMRDLCGVAATRQILALQPTARILALSCCDDTAFVTAMLDAGGLGYLRKDDPFAELLHAIGEVAAGRYYLSRAVAATLRLLTPQSPHTAD